MYYFGCEWTWDDMIVLIYQGDGDEHETRSSAKDQEIP
jgi:hypothetical protein